MACGHLLEGLPVEISHEQRITWMALYFTTGSISGFVRIVANSLHLLTMICCLYIVKLTYLCVITSYNNANYLRQGAVNGM